MTRLVPRKLGAVVICGLACAWQPARSQEPASDTASSADLLKGLRALVAERDANLARQERAWPTRQADQAAEAPVPLAVRELQAAQRELERNMQGTIRQVERAAADDPGPLLTTLSATDSFSLANALAPLVARCARSDPRAFDSLAAAARRFRPPPLTVVRALEALDTGPADFLLLQMGKESLDATLLRAAASSGDATIIATLIRWADGDDKALARSSLRALSGLEPPAARALSSTATAPPGVAPPRDAGEAAVYALMQKEAAGNPRVDLTLMVTREILAARSPELKVTLLGYLALFKDAALGAFFDSLYRSEASEPLRVAAISALSRLGDRSSDLLLAELASPTNATSIRKVCAHGLGAARCKPAARQLIACLDEPELEADALRALCGIAGTKVGKRSADWIRWWRAQPECKPEDRDLEQE